MKKEYIAPCAIAYNVTKTSLLADSSITYNGSNKDTTGGLNPPPTIAESKGAYDDFDDNFDDDENFD